MNNLIEESLNFDINRIIQNEKEALHAEIDYEEQREVQSKKIIADIDEKFKKNRLAFTYKHFY